MADDPNAIVIENTKLGIPKDYWDASHSNQIEGFAADISYDIGQTVQFKINVNGAAADALPYKIEIFRLGYYGGNGATLVKTIHNADGAVQPNPITDSRGLVDAGNWSVTDSWQIPEEAVSGVYLARLQRLDSNGNPIDGATNQIPFIVRDDTPADGTKSDIVLQTSDTTWHAYNGWAGNNGQVGANFYGDASGTINHPDVANPGLGDQDRAYAVSYNRPFITRDGTSPASGAQDYLFGADYAAIYWLEKNGYDVSYISGVDTDRLGAANLIGHKAYISVGHDEYWSAAQRESVEAARDAGVNLLFWSGNEVYWKTRYEPSIDGSNTDYRTLISYKETWANGNPNAAPADYANIDPSNEWTGTWRDLRFVDSVDANGVHTAIGAKPENALTGQLFGPDGTGEPGGALDIPASFAGLRVWRDTGVAQTGTVDIAPGILGYEWDTSPEDQFRPAGLIKLSETTIPWSAILVDQGNHTQPGTATHNLSLYRDAESGALVFGAGTVFWSWGLSDEHDSSPYGANIESLAIQQFTVNLFADMGIQPGVTDAILASQGLVRATASTDTVAATTTLVDLQDVSALQTVTITGTATDDDGNAATADGKVAVVEVSVDGGATWRVAEGTSNWSYQWRPTAEGDYTIKARAIDDSLNIASITPATDTVHVTAPVPPDTFSLFDSQPVTGTPFNDGQPIELGVKFRAAQAGEITELKYYRAAGDAGDIDVREGHLWSSSGTLLATVTFTSGVNDAGWQVASLSNPVPILANTDYIVSYRTNDNYFSANAFFDPVREVAYDGADDDAFTDPFGVLSAPQNTVVGDAGFNGNGVYKYGAAIQMPNETFKSSNYWVDLTFDPTEGPNTPPSFTSPASFNAAENQIAAGTLTATDAEGNALVFAIAGGADAGKFTINPATGALTFNAAPDYEAPNDSGGNNVYDLTVNVSDGIAPAVTQDITVNVTDTVEAALSNLFADAPATFETQDQTDYELGVKFEANQTGVITALRYYRGAVDADDIDIRTLNLWEADGDPLGSVVVTSNLNEIGWQVGTLSTPIPIQADTIYIASYGTTENYAFTGGYFASNRPGPDGVLTAPASGQPSGLSSGGVGNGLFSSSQDQGQGPGIFPTNSFNATNYWVDVFFDAADAPNADPVIDSNDGGAMAAVTIDENTTLVTTVAATDADLPAQTLTYSKAGGEDAALFTIDPTTGVLAFATAPNFEAPNAGATPGYQVTVQVSDGAGGTDQQDITVSVANVAEAPTPGFDGKTIQAAYIFGASPTDQLGFSPQTATVDAGVEFDNFPELAGTNVIGNDGEGLVDIDISGSTILYTFGLGETVFQGNFADFGTQLLNGVQLTDIGGVLPDIVGVTLTAQSGFTQASSHGESPGVEQSDISFTADSIFVNWRGERRDDDATLTLNVDFLNIAPAGTDAAVSTAEDTPRAFTSADFGFTDEADGAADNFASVVITTLPTAGALTFQGNPVAAGAEIPVANFAQLVFTPAPNGNGAGYSSFTFQVRDDGGTTAGGIDTDQTPNTLTINVNPVNEAPVAVNDAYTTDEDTPLTVAAAGVLANDSDIDSSNLNAVLVTGPSHGGLTLNADGSFTYTPAADFNGADSFSYTITDGTDMSAPAIVTVNVTPVNDPPTIDLDADNSHTQPSVGYVGFWTEASPESMNGVPIADVDVLISDPDNTHLVSANVTLDAQAGDFLFVSGFVPDGISVQEPAPGMGGEMTLTFIAQPGYGTLADFETALEAVRFVPEYGEPLSGGRAFTIIVNDGENNTSATSLILIQPSNDPPELYLDRDGSSPAPSITDYETTFTEGGTAVAIADTDVSIIDLENNNIQRAFVGLTNAQAGDNLSINGALPDGLTAEINVFDGVIHLDLSGTATPAAYQAALQQVVFSNSSDNPSTIDRNIAVFVTDDGQTIGLPGNATSNVATARIHVTPVNDAPVAVNDAYTTDEDTPLTVAAAGVLANDSDIDSNNLNAVLVTGPSHGGLTLNADGSFTYTPAADFNGADSFSYKTNDGSLNSDVATVAIAVNPLNDAPVAVNDAYVTDEDTPLTVAAAGVLANDSDIDSSNLNAVPVTGPSHGDLTLNADGSFTYTPAADFNGADSFSYKTNDGSLNSDVATVAIAVNPQVNTPPDVQLHAYDKGNYLDQFNITAYNNSNGATPWTSTWQESADQGGGITGGQIRINSSQLQFRDNGNGALIQRGVNLEGAVSAKLSYNFNENGLDSGEQVRVYFDNDTSDLIGPVLLQTITSTSNQGSSSIALTGPFTANAAVRLEVGGGNSSNDFVRLDNVRIDFTKPAAAPTTNYIATFREDSSPVAIASGPGLVAEGATLVSAKAVLTNARARDVLAVGALPAGITASVNTATAGVITVNFAGTATLAAYQAALESITFASTSQNPDPQDRTIEVTVNDGSGDSNVATSTIHVVPVNDRPNAVNDAVVTNVTTGSFDVPEWALLANDSDPDSALNITAVTESQSSFSVTPVADHITITKSTSSVRQFTYTDSDGLLSDNATVTVATDSNNIDAGSGNQIIIGNGASTSIDAGTGNDIILAGAGNDTIIWNANTLATDGHDFVDGGTGSDTLSVVGNNSVENFVVHARADAESAGIPVLYADTEIVVTRNGTSIAELDNVERLQINASGGNDLVTGGPGNDVLSAGTGNDTVIGGLGADTLSGGIGQDVFVYRSSNEGGDSITGFVVADDTLRISATGFGGTAAGIQSGQSLTANQFVANATPTAPTAGMGAFLYDTDAQDLLWDQDGADGAAAVQIAHFDTTVNLQANDFDIVA